MCRNFKPLRTRNIDPLLTIQALGKTCRPERTLRLRSPCTRDESVLMSNPQVDALAPCVVRTPFARDSAALLRAVLFRLCEK